MTLTIYVYSVVSEAYYRIINPYAFPKYNLNLF